MVFPLDERLQSERHEGEKREQRGDRKGCDKVVLVVENLDVQRHGVGFAPDVAGGSIGEESVVSTPFLDPFNDGVQLFIDARTSEIMLHDGGRTVDNLQTLGVDIEDSERRQALIRRALTGSPVEFSGSRLQTRATAGNFAQRAHFLMAAINRLNDLWMSAVPHTWTDFFEIVSEFMDEQGVLYTANVSLPGKTVEHPIDFVIPLPKKRERLIKLVASPRPASAKLVSFTWLELSASRPLAERVVVVNDVRTPDPFESQTEDQFRAVSDQTIAILQGYSTGVFRWSDRASPQFRELWMPGRN